MDIFKLGEKRVQSVGKATLQPGRPQKFPRLQPHMMADKSVVNVNQNPNDSWNGVEGPTLGQMGLELEDDEDAESDSY